MYDIIIIGSGIAGMTAAIYGQRANKKCLVLEKFTYGGQIINSSDVENYPGYSHISGYDLSVNIYNQMIETGAEYKCEKVKKIEIGRGRKIVLTDKNKYIGKTVIIATGKENRKLGLDNEDKFIGSGVSYCATCDGNFYKNKIVAIVGGGNTAIDDAIYLSNICEKVYLIHRRNTFRAEASKVEVLKNKANVSFIYNSNITKLIGSDNLESIEVTNEDKKQKIKVDGLFIAIGGIPQNKDLNDKLKLDDDGYIISRNCHTNVKGIFVAGDNRKKELRQLVTAASDGAEAANEAIMYLNN